MRIIAKRTVTNNFTIPTNAPYEINIYAQTKVPYADCLLGQTNSYPGISPLCARHTRVLDVAWVLHGKDGRVLRQGVSGGTCCTYTTDDHNNGVVYATLADFQLPAGTTAYLELKHRRDVSKLQNVSPRIVVERSDPEESELGLEIWSFLGIGMLVLIDLVMVMKGWIEYRAFRASRLALNQEL